MSAATATAYRGGDFAGLESLAAAVRWGWFPQLPGWGPGESATSADGSMRRRLSGHFLASVGGGGAGVPGGPVGGRGSGTDSVGGYHTPVLSAEVVEAFAAGPGKLYLDGTLGGGGHTLSLLERGASVIGIDQDPEAIAAATARAAAYGSQLTTFQMNFREFPKVLEEAGVCGLDGILLDLGVSSRHLDSAERGFSFDRPGPLNMRMDASEEGTAADFINSASAEEMADVFFRYGEERQSRRIAAAIVRERQRTPILRTDELAEVVSAAVGGRKGRRHPATRVFQALRIAVNDEIGALETALSAVREWLVPGGVLAVISFHSLEDRVVKRFMRDACRPTLDRPEWPEPRPNPNYFLTQDTRRAIVAGEEELTLNPRSRSAKLRVARKVVTDGA